MVSVSSGVPRCFQREGGGGANQTGGAMRGVALTNAAINHSMVRL